MSSTLITNARMVNEGRTFDGDLRIENGRIAQIGTGLAPREGEEVVDAAGRWLLPGMIDDQVIGSDPEFRPAGIYIRLVRRAEAFDVHRRCGDLDIWKPIIFHGFGDIPAHRREDVELLGAPRKDAFDDRLAPTTADLGDWAVEGVECRELEFPFECAGDDEIIGEAGMAMDDIKLILMRLGPGQYCFAKLEPELHRACFLELEERVQLESFIDLSRALGGTTNNSDRVPGLGLCKRKCEQATRVPADDGASAEVRELWDDMQNSHRGIGRVLFCVHVFVVALCEFGLDIGRWSLV